MKLKFSVGFYFTFIGIL